MWPIFCFLLFCAIATLAFCENVLWHKTHPQAFWGMDSEHHFVRGLIIHDDLFLDQEEPQYEGQIQLYARWPPLVYFVSSISMTGFGRSQFVMRMSISIFLLILLFYSYLLAARLINPAAGVLATALLYSSSHLILFSRWYNLDLALAALTTAAMYHLIVSDLFTRRKQSIAFGLACGLGCLTKTVFPVYMTFIVLSFLLVYKDNVHKKTSCFQSPSARLSLRSGTCRDLSRFHMFIFPTFSIT